VDQQFDVLVDVLVNFGSRWMSLNDSSRYSEASPAADLSLYSTELGLSASKSVASNDTVPS